MKRLKSLIIVLGVVFTTQLSFGATSNTPTITLQLIRDELNTITVERGNSAETLQNNLMNFTRLNKLALKTGHFNSEFSKKIQIIIADNEVISGAQLDIMSKLVDTFQLMALRYIQFLLVYKPLEDLPSDEMFPLDDAKVLKKNMIWYTAQLYLFDILIDSYDGYWRDGNIRRVVKNIFLSKKNIEGLMELAERILSKENRKMLKAHAKSLRRNWGNILDLNDQDIEVITDELANNKSTREILDRSYGVLSNHGFMDSVISFLGRVTNFVSGVFGNIVGAVRWRHGYLFDDHYAYNAIKDHLKPLDILVEKTPFALTDTFIPGHYGHAAIWLGTEEQLKAYGFWDLPAIVPFHEKIRQGYNIIEAVRPGVRLNTLKEFMEIDEIGIIRDPRALTNKKAVNIIYSRSFEHLGKKYDFNFDVATTDKIVCSELVFLAFGHIDWPTEYIWGRNTISPDNVASLIFYEHSPIELEYSIYSKKKGEILPVTLDDLADRLDFVRSENQHTSGQTMYDKKIKSCRTVTVRTPFNDNVEHKRVCTTKYKHYVYDPGERDEAWRKWYLTDKSIK